MDPINLYDRESDDDIDEEEDRMEQEMLGINMECSLEEFLDSTGKVVATKNSPTIAKRRKKTATNTTLYNEHLALVGKTSRKMLTLLEGDMVDSSPPTLTQKKHTLENAMVIIKEMVRVGCLVEGENLWCFAVSEMLKEDIRSLFMTIQKNEARLACLRYQFKIFGPK